MPFSTATDGGRRAIYSAIVSTAVAAAVVLIRFVQKSKKTNVALDDWLLLFALILLAISCGVLIWGNLSLKTTHITDFYKSLLINSCLYPMITTAIKISLLSLYRRVFVTRSFKKTVYIIGAIALSWGIAITLVSAMTCLPSEKFWKPTRPGRCINFNVFSLANGILEMLIDTSILLLPIPMIMNLKLSRGNRFGLSGIFLLGAFIIVTGIIRLKESYVPNSATGHVNFDEVNFWSFIHVATGILCASFPTYRLGSFIKTVSSFGTSLRRRYALYGTRNTEIASNRDRTGESGSSGSPKERYKTAGYDKMSEESRDCVHLTEIHGGRSSSNDERLDGHPADKVFVERTVEVV